MNREPEILTLPDQSLVGLRTEMSLSDNRTRELWTSFRSRTAEVDHRLGEGFYSVQYYPKFQEFTPQTVFSKWACVRVSEVEKLPEGMETIILEGGLWARFLYQGTVAKFQAMWLWMYQQWLPDSGYTLDDRHHYEYLDHRWLGPHNEQSMEDIYLPIKPQGS